MTGAIWELDLLFRIFLAGICGGLIGYERNSRLKEAGIRTHLIVALGAALMMIVSKYGFADVTDLKGVALDPSRVAAQIVTGVGFLGAGMIFVRNQNISGLTTAAGIWATAGIGMAIGAGLYFLGVAGTALIVILQIMLHKDFKWLRFPVVEKIYIEVVDQGEGIALVQDVVKRSPLEVLSIKGSNLDNGRLRVELCVKFPSGYDLTRLLNFLHDNPNVKSVMS